MSTENTNTKPQKTTENKKTSSVCGTRYNVQNLKPFNPKYSNTLSSEEAQRRGRLGGIKSGEVRRERKTMKENILSMLSQEMTPEKLEEMGVDTSTLNGDYTLQNAIISAMLREAINGDTKAMQLLRDTIDEAPTTRQEVKTEIVSQEDLKTIDNLKSYLIG